VLVEALWVLRSVYEVDAKRIASAVDLLLDHRELALQDADVVRAALTHFKKRPSLGFSDCLIVEIARKAGHDPLGTFDRDFAKVHGVERL
jgi:predicted nucleic-acid-binding protein